MITSPISSFRNSDRHTCWSRVQEILECHKHKIYGDILAFNINFRNHIYPILWKLLLENPEYRIVEQLHCPINHVLTILFSFVIFRDIRWLFPLIHVSLLFPLSQTTESMLIMFGLGFHGLRWYLNVYLSGLETVDYRFYFSLTISRPWLLSPER